MAKANPKTKKSNVPAGRAKVAFGEDALDLVATNTDTDMDVAKNQPDMLPLDSAPLSESLKTISEQAKDWAYMDKPAPTKPAPAEFSFKPVRPPTKKSTRINWAMWACALGMAVTAAAALQILMIDRQMAKNQTIEMQNLNTNIEKINADLATLKERVLF